MSYSLTNELSSNHPGSFGVRIYRTSLLSRNSDGTYNSFSKIRKGIMSAGDFYYTLHVEPTSKTSSHHVMQTRIQSLYGKVF